MGINLQKTSHILFFIVILPAISFGIGWLFALAFPSVPFWVETISPLAAYGLLYSLFEKHMWHWPVFRWLGIVSAPDVRGRWLGEQVSSFKDKNGKPIKSRVIMEIVQTFSGVKLETYYKNWHNEQCIASFILVESECTLFVMFDAAPKASYDGDASAHKGVMRLTQQSPGRLIGTYFNGAGRHGEMSFKRTRYTLHRTFESVGEKA
jgi:hypothetical protein